MGSEPQLQILPPAQLRFWRQRPAIPRDFVLYGGTAVALRLGHRSSEGFVFFSAEPFETGELLHTLPFASEAEVLQSARNSLTLRIDCDGSVKLSFFGGLTFGQVALPSAVASQSFPIASIAELMATKLNVLWQRAEARDYLDVAAIVRAGIALDYGLGCAVALYGESFNPALVLKALTYFEDGDLRTLGSDVRELLIEAAKGVRKIPEVRLATRRIGPLADAPGG